MDFSLNDEQQMLKDSVEKYRGDHYGAGQRPGYLANDCGYSAENWIAFAELGWLSIPFSEELGGFGGGIIEIAALMESFGQALVVEPYLQNILLAGQLLARGGQAEVREDIVPRLIAGDVQLGFGWQERNSRFDAQHVECQASRTGDGYALTGEKTLVGNAAADYFVISARTSGNVDEPAGISLFLVDASAAGLQRTDYRLMDGSCVVNVRFDSFPVAATALIGAEGKAAPLIQQVLAEACVAVCAEAVGAMDYLYKATAEYANTRKQFGQSIGSFQALQHRLVDMYMQTEQCRSLLVRAVCAIADDSASQAQDVAALKAMVGKYGRKLAEEAVQLHGGMGFSDEMPVGHYLKRLMMIDVSFGNSDFHRRRFCELSYSPQSRAATMLKTA